MIYEIIELMVGRKAEMVVQSRVSNSTIKPMASVAINPRRRDGFPVVGVGASAGGLKAYTQFLQALPTNSGMAFVLVQHLDPKHKSGLVELLARTTKLPVTEIKDGHEVQPNNVYIIPENTELTIKNGRLQLHPRVKSEQPSLPINRFLISLADDQQANSIGVILSGAANDGTLGLKAIKAAGGITFVQDESADTTSMPESAIRAGVADFTLPPDEIAKALIGVSRQHHTMRQKLVQMPEPAVETTDFDRILMLLERRTNVDMTIYKTAMLHRRVQRRLVMLNLHSIGEYFLYLEANPAEIDVLYQDMLINVTSFFRDNLTLDLLRKQLLPELAKNAATDQPLRIWVAGCASGEEAYSFAIICREFLNQQPRRVTIKIFATDLNAVAIAQARSGLYPASELADISKTRQKQFFIPEGGGYRVKDSIRDMCVFAVHNLVIDPPFSSMNFISCCNVLIYLQPNAQQKLLRNFHYALKPNGLLALGPSESVGNTRTLFRQLDKKYKIYSRKPVPTPHHFDTTSHYSTRNLGVSMNREIEPVSDDIDVSTLANDLLLSNYAPASVVIDSNLNIVQFRGSTSAYLEAAPGKASFNLLKMARPGLALHLRKAIRQIKKNNKSYTGNANIKLGETTQTITFDAIPLSNGDDSEPFILIVFRDDPDGSDAGINLEAATRLQPATMKADAKDHQIIQLDREFVELQDEMRRLSEDHEVANEELQLANEEVRSSNEELQSLNEELETTSEELASTNEELTIMNQTLQASNEALMAARDYAEAIIRTMRESLIVLGPDLKVITANDSFYQTFGVPQNSAVGHSIYELGNGQWRIPKLQVFLEDILSKNSSFQNYTVSHDFPEIGPKIMLLDARRVRTGKSDSHMILLAIEDITERRQGEQNLQASADRLRFTAESMPQKIFTALPNGTIDYINPQWTEFTGLSFEQIRDLGWSQFIHPDDVNETIRQWQHSIESGKPFQQEHRFRRRDGVYHWHLSRAHALQDHSGNIVMWAGSNTDIENTVQTKKRTEELVKSTLVLKRQRSQLIALSEAKDEFINLASHQLRTPATGVKQYVSMLLEGYAGTVTSSQREFLELANESNERQLKIIEDLLKVAQADSGHMHLDTTSTDLVPLIESVIEEQSLRFEERQQHVSFNHKEPSLNVLIDWDKIRMVLENLIDNASKYTHAGKSITVTLVRSKDDVQIAFKDEGVGIAEKQVSQLFQKFSRLSNDVSVLVGGSGLGLYLSKKIIDLHHGSITVTSVPGKGSTFTVIIPTDATNQRTT